MQLLRLFFLVLCALNWQSQLFAANQTPDTSPILSGDQLPFEVKIKTADFHLPSGWHSGAFATHEGKWLLLAGRTNGLHGFSDSESNFPPSAQNTSVMVVDPCSGRTWSRSLEDSDSGLTQEQIDLLSVTSPQFYQKKKTLYITGGYGVDTATGEFSTKDCLTAIDVPGLMHWVVKGHHRASSYIRQIFHPIFQVTGGEMSQYGDDPTLLVFGQNFEGFYFEGGSGIYTNEVRRFNIIDDGHHLSINVLAPLPIMPDPTFRRRDLNVVPIIQIINNQVIPQLVAFSGVFTPTGGAWTVPVTISTDGTASMQDPTRRTTFKQGMNNYDCATAGIFSIKHWKMYTIFFGGISFVYVEDGRFKTDSELPFINSVTTIRGDQFGNFKQYLMDAEFPTILSTESNPGNTLLFGASALFVPVEDFPDYSNGVLKFEALEEHPRLLGYIVGGIQSTLPNTNTITDSSASDYVFKVFAKKGH